MPDLIVSRRKFLIGSAAALAAAAPAARLLRIPPALAAIGKRSSYSFTLVPSLEEMIYRIDPVARTIDDARFVARRFAYDNRKPQPITIERHGNTEFIQLEEGGFATSYIRTEGEAATRAGDILYVPTAQAKSTDKGNIVFAPGMRVERQSSAYLVENGGVTHIAADCPRLDADGGVILEGASTNYLFHSERPWKSEDHLLPPGEYTISWYGDGRVRVIGEGVALVHNRSKVMRIGSCSMDLAELR